MPITLIGASDPKAMEIAFYRNAFHGGSTVYSSPEEVIAASAITQDYYLEGFQIATEAQDISVKVKYTYGAGATQVMECAFYMPASATTKVNTFWYNFGDGLWIPANSVLNVLQMFVSIASTKDVEIVTHVRIPR